MSATVTFSELLRRPGDVVARLDAGDVLLTRRQESTLRLSYADDVADQEAAMVAVAHLAHTCVEDTGLSHPDRFVKVFRWLEFIPAEHHQKFIAEFSRTMLACAEIGRFAALGRVLNAWKDTARAYAEGADAAPAYLAEPIAVPDPHS